MRPNTALKAMRCPAVIETSGLPLANSSATATASTISAATPAKPHC